MLREAEVKQHELQQKAVHAHFEELEAPEPPCWSEEGLVIAEAIRKHLHIVRIGMPDNIEGDAAYAHYIDSLRQICGNLIQIVPADTQAAERGRDQHRQFAEHRR